MTVKEIERVDRPREKLAKYGPDKLSEAELLAILLRSGVKGKNVLELAGEITDKFRERGFEYGNLAELRKFCGIGEAKACELVACFELGKRYLKEKKNSIYLKPKDVFAELREFRALKKEHFIVLYLDTKNQEIKKQVVSIGTLNFSVVHPREVFEEAVRSLSASVIISHNHPSGSVEPSEEDLRLTKRLVEAGKILGIEVLDHVIISKEKYFSFKENGLI